ncbi:hypothetical protein [Pelomonas sp. SE-A7]|uniref:hypothetical protein n=1 Tax=Pelomonas sp. SE-A7 TaxID=3054953 RepID=UPI00259C8A09|nr:hypothetical protein [Pelomonas sp. SE-A7]MDM4764559.1 hypothetical protein [Pelomonas sp. SE-A7]
MATPNYSYEKRQRELAKKRKNEEKRQRKLNRTEGGAEQTDGEADAGSDAPAVPQGEQPSES